MVYRLTKGIALTHEEMDENLRRLNDQLGKNQTFQDMTSQRSMGVVETNNLGSPIELIIVVSFGSSARASLFIDSIPMALIDGTINQKQTINVVIPPGSSYSLTGVQVAISTWYELRN